MGLFEQFPYTNFHELNLDWVIQTTKAAEAISQDAAEIARNTRSYVDDYFDNLDLTDEVDDILHQMAIDGEINALIDPVILAALPPDVVDSAADMEDINRTYILRGNSHIYQYVNGAFADTGIVYGSSIGNVCTFYGTLASPNLLSGLTEQSIYHVSGGYVPSDAPVNVHGTVTTIGDATTKIQEYQTFGKDTTYYRSYSSGT